MLAALLIQLAAMATHNDMEVVLCQRVIKFLDALAGVIPFNPYVDFGEETNELIGLGTVYFASNLRLSRNCTIQKPNVNKKKINFDLTEDLVIYLNNGKWINVPDCGINFSVGVSRSEDGKSISMRTSDVAVTGLGAVTVNDTEPLGAASYTLLKATLSAALTDLGHKYLSFTYNSTSVFIDQGLAYHFFRQVYQVFLSVL